MNDRDKLQIKLCILEGAIKNANVCMNEEYDGEYAKLQLAKPTSKIFHQIKMHNGYSKDIHLDDYKEFTKLKRELIQYGALIQIKVQGGKSLLFPTPEGIRYYFFVSRDSVNAFLAKNKLLGELKNQSKQYVKVRGSITAEDEEDSD